MPFLDLALTNYNQQTGRYNLARAKNGSGDVAFDGTAAYSVMSSVVCKLGWYWRDRNFGSSLYRFKNVTRFTPSPTPSQAGAAVLSALAQLQRNNIIATGSTVKAKPLAFGPLTRLAVDLNWSTPGGAQGSGTVPVG